jgi:hypothetical protein
MTEQKLSQSGGLTAIEARVLAFLRKGEGFFEDLILELHAAQRSLCPSYGAFCASRAYPSDWREIPAIPLDAFRQTAIRSFPAEETVCIFHTSGTTGEGHGEHHFHTLDLYHAAALGGWRRAGLPENVVFCLVPLPAEATHSSLSRMAGWLAPGGNFFLGDWDGLSVRLARQEGKTVLFGTALAFLDLFTSLGDRTLALPPGSLAVETGGYKGTSRILPKTELYTLFLAKLGLAPESIWNEYGMTELSSQFYSRGLGQPHRGAPWVRALVIDPETGRECADGGTGVLRIFDLANTGSCCALQTRDLAIRRGGDFELIGRDPAALPRGCSRAADEMLQRSSFTRVAPSAPLLQNNCPAPTRSSRIQTSGPPRHKPAAIEVAIGRLAQIGQFSTPKHPTVSNRLENGISGNGEFMKTSRE